MNNILKSIIASAVAGAVVVAIALTFFAPHATVVQQKVGGAPDFSNSPYLTVNGVTEWYSQVGMAQGNATTTVCSFQAPAASTTIQYVTARFGGITSSGITFSIGTSTTAQGSTGTLLASSVAATGTGYGYLGTSFASTTLSSGNFLNVVISGLATTTGGSCQAEFTQY